MNIRTLRILVLFFLSAFSSSRVFAHDDQAQSMASAHGSLVPAKEAPSDWVAKQKADYPSDTCFVSGDKLEGDMGKPQDYVYKQPGKSDRFVRFCCKDCLKDFKKNPDKYLDQLDAAAAKKSADSAHSAAGH